ncbi:MAG TPA: response regulator [Pyrinomonadaceae bacterium]|jgi:DNA-binding response OmpR family regulator
MATILIVDDDTVIREVLSELFNSEHTCHTAETAEQALKLLESTPCDVAIVDISLPGISGLELLGHIRQRWPETRVIIITGIDYHQYVEDLVKMGATDYLVKPFRLHDAEAKVGRAILQEEGWLDALKESTERALKQDQPPAKEEVLAGIIERRAAVRHTLKRDARLLFTIAPSEQSSAEDPQPIPALVGHTRDISETGLSLVVPGVNESDAKFFGARSQLQIILSLPTAMIAIEVTPVRYQWLEEHGGKKSYLIGGRIARMSPDDTTLFREYLGQALTSYRKGVEAE